MEFANWSPTIWGQNSGKKITAASQPGSYAASRTRRVGAVRDWDYGEGQEASETTIFPESMVSCPGGLSSKRAGGTR